MKKVKYLLWLSIIWLWLLINQSFWDDLLFVDWNFITPVNSTTNQYSSYLYEFKSIDVGSRDWNFWWLWYNLIYDNINHFSWIPNCVWWQYNESLNFWSLNSVDFNNSILSFSPFNWWAVRTSNDNYKCTVNSIYPGPIKYLLWYSDTSIWKNFIYLWTYTTTGSVKYWIWDWFAWSEAWFYDEFSTSDSNYLRILYRSSVSTNNNPFNDLNPVNLSGSENFNNWDFLWEIYYPRWTRNNYWYVIDDWYYYTKYKHFGGFQLWYSYTFNRFEFTTWINWDWLWFRTVSDSIEVYQSINGSLPYSEFSSYNNPTISNNYNYSRNWVLALKSNSYYSLWNLNWVYLLSKNPNNTKQILYEHWSCELFNIDSMIKWTNNCVKLDWWYLTYNWNTDVLPFQTKLLTYDITSLNSDYPLLYDLLWDSSNSHWYTKLWNNCIYINQDERCYWFSSDSSVNILEIYLNQSVPGWDYSGNYSWTWSFWYDCVDTQVCRDYTWDNWDVYSICTTKCVSQGSIDSSWNYISQDWTIYYIDSSLDIDNLFNWTDNSYISWFIDDDWMLSLSYYTWLFNSLSDFSIGRCPYPPSDFLGFATKVRIWKFYPFMFLNCWASAFNQGMKVHYFDDFWLFPDLSSQLIQWDTHFHKTLFRFFDILLSLWVILLLSALVRLIKK